MRHRLMILVLAMVLAVAAGACSFDPVPMSARTPAPITPDTTATDPYEQDRLLLVARTMRARGLQDEQVLQVMEKVPRHLFVPADLVSQAYADHPLPIGYGQTISQPYIVALMTELLQLSPTDKVLEIGTGSGYQAAVLAELVDEVWTIEIVPQLADEAAVRFQNLGYDRVHTKIADGYYGWPEAAPFDAIIVTAAPDHIPQPLLDQLSPGGRLVLPVGPPGGYQTLWQLVKEGEEVTAYNLGGVLFVPLVGAGQSGKR